MSKAFYFILALAIAGGSLAITNPFGLPLVYADNLIYRGYEVDEIPTIIRQEQNYSIAQFVNGTFQHINHFNYFQDENLTFIPYRVTETDEVLQIETDRTKFVFDKNTGGVTTFNDNEIKIQSDSYIIRTAELNTDNWQNLQVNDSPITVSYEEINSELIQVTISRSNFEGNYDLVYTIAGSQIKTTAKFENLFFDNNKFAFTQTLNLQDNFIELNNQVIDLSQFVGQTFPREVLLDNMDLILQAGDLYYYSGLGFDNLWSVGIFDGNRIALDYANVEQTQTEIGQTVELDPSYGISNGNQRWKYEWYSGASSASCFTSTSSYSGTSGVGMVKQKGYNAGNCANTSYKFNTSSIPDGATVTGVTWNALTDTKVGGNLLGGVTKIDDGDCTASNASSTSTKIINNYLNSSYDASYLYYFTNGGYGTAHNFNFKAKGITYVQDAIDGDDIICLGVSTTVSNYNGGYASPLYVTLQNNESLIVTYTLPPPDAPTGLTITQSTANELDLSWTAPTSGTTPTGYKIERSLDNSNWTTVTADTGNTNTTYTDTSLSYNTLYYYRVFSYDSGGVQYSTTSTDSSQTTWDAPAQVTGLIATGGNPISLTWNVPASDDTIINYKVYRDTVFLKTVVGTSTTDTPPSFGSSYSYTVSAVSAVGEGAQSTSSSAVYGTSPDPPTGVTTAIQNPDTNPLDIFIQYSSPTNVGTGTLTGFEIVRDGSVVATVGLVTSYIDTVPSAGTYTYLVRAIATHGTSSDSNTSNITTPTTADPPTLSLVINNPNPNPFDITVSITPPVNNGGSAVTGYNIYSSPDDNTYTLESSNITTAQTITVSGQGTWYFKAESINPIGTGSLSTAFSIATPTVPSAINNLSATANTDTAIALSWSSPNNGGSAVTLYKVFQDAVQIDTTTNTSYTVTGLSPNTSYDFTVITSNNVGDSTASNTATQTTYLEITGHIDLTATTQGSTTQFIFSANVTAGTPTPTFSTFDIKENGITIASNISSPYNLKLTDTATHTYTIISTDNTHWNTPSINGTVSGITASYQADWQTDLLGTNEVAYNLSRANDQLNLVVNRDTGTNTWHLNCNYRTNTQILAGNNGTWYEVNSWYYDDTQSINDASIVYIDCYNDDLILQITSYSSDRTGGGIAVLNGFFEDWTGTPVALFFVLLVAGLFSGRTAPTGILLMLAIVGVMGFVGLLVIDEVVWAFILLVGVLGLFVGKRFL